MYILLKLINSCTILSLILFILKSYYDGCWTNNNPVINNESLTVAPFMGESDICPKRESGAFHLTDFQNTSVLWCFENVNRVFKVFFPPEKKLASEIYYMGYRDAVIYLQSLGILLILFSRLFFKVQV